MAQFGLDIPGNQSGRPGMQDTPASEILLCELASACEKLSTAAATTFPSEAAEAHAEAISRAGSDIAVLAAACGVLLRREADSSR